MPRRQLGLESKSRNRCNHCLVPLPVPFRGFSRINCDKPKEPPCESPHRHFDGPDEAIKPYKDTSFAILLAAQARGCEIQYMTPADLSIDCGVPMGHMAGLTVRDQSKDFSR